MNKPISLLLFTFFAFKAIAQSVTPLYNGAAGGYGGTNLGSTAWAVGEPVIFTSSPTGELTQGFLQPLYRAGQTIVGFNPLPAAVFGNPSVSLTGIATSGLPVSFTSSDNNIVIVSGKKAIIIGTGTVTITATQVGNTQFRPALPVSQLLVINKIPQSITGFTNIPILSVGNSYAIQNVRGGNSGNPILFTSTDTSIVGINGNSLSPLIAGIVTITASQAGNDNFQDAVSIAIPVTVSAVTTKLTQQITGLPNLIIMGVGDEKTISGTATSNLPVLYSVNNTNVTLVGGVLGAVASGASTLTASQDGDDNYFPAAVVSIQILITASGVNSSVSGIIGKETVVPSLTTSFTQTLQGQGYTYSWKYTGGRVSYQGDSTVSTVTISFPKDAKSGQLYSYVYDSNGNLVDFSVHNITVATSTEADLANQLKEVECTQQASDCSSDYINSFQLGKISNLNSGCSPSGFGDFTATGKLDTLLMGDSYEATISSYSGTNASYFAIWIDYSNNGSFDDPGEFVGSSFASDSVFVLHNLLVANDPAFAGPRRLRVKMQTSGKISATQSCNATQGGGGETEDYLVYLQQADRLKAPNVITPNNDGKNDLFVIRGVNAKKGRKLVIVDRNGQVKFEDPDYNNDWNGVDNHKNSLPRGTYFYFFTNGPDFIQGFVEVIND